MSAAVAALAALASWLAAAAPHASSGSASAPPPRPRQDGRVSLQLRPRERDTVRTRFEQTVEVSGPIRPGSDTLVTRRNVLVVLSHSVVERTTAAGAVVLAVTDSVVLSAAGADARALDAERRGMQGRQARMLVTPTGASEMLDPGRAAGAEPSGASKHAKFPGTLPAEPVAVGDRWSREMPLPLGTSDAQTAGGRGAGRGGKISVVFRLDSLGARGTLAYVSMSGSLARVGRDARGARLDVRGTLVGGIVVDLRRGWLADSRSTFVTTSDLTPADTSAARPARLKLKVVQRLRTM